MLNKIGIGITTRDRWDDLYATLEELEKFGLGGCETIVMDDASRELVPEAMRTRFPNVSFQRSEQACFVPGQRNRLARLLSPPYFFQLDDDSFPVLGDLARAAAWLEENEDALALAFIVTDRNEFAAKLAAVPADPFRCHFFIGCAGLINRQMFLEVGSYEESFEYNCEEVELALHAQLRGWFVYQYPAVVVQHNRSPLARDNGRRLSLLVRNELLVAGLRYPFFFLMLRWPVFLLKALFLRWASVGEIARGVRGALKMYPAIWLRREAVSSRAFLAWKRLPGPIEFRSPP